MLHTLKECLSSPDIKTVKIATGYWDIPGLALLTDDIKAFLEKEDTKLLLLIGKDPYVYASQVKNPKYKDKNYPADFIRTDLCELEPKEEFENAVRLLLDFCTEGEDSKIQIRIFRKNEEDETQFLHSKCYIFDGLNVGKGYGLIGSSNFTQKGLQGNAELNYLETDVTKVLSTTPIPNHKTHVQWFDEKWNISEPWNKEFLEQVLKQAPITKKVEDEDKDEPFSPYELYIKLLQIKFGDIVDKSLGQQIENYLPANIHKLEYQIEAVKRCIGIMHEHGGFMLADVVGLGKTIIGTLIIKRFLSVPEDDGGQGHAGYAHVEGDDKDQVQHHIDHTGNAQEVQGAAGVPLGPENGAAEVIEHIGGHTAEVDPQVQGGQADDVVRGGHELQHLAAEEYTGDEQDHAAAGGQGDGGVYRPADVVPPPGPQVPGHHHIGAHGEAHKQGDEQVDERGGGANGG